MGYPDEEARGALRLSVGRGTTAEEIADAARLITQTIKVQREAAASLRARDLVLAATRFPETDGTSAEAAAE
jgi:hypothetical protein